jgi:hypothetical protein
MRSSGASGLVMRSYDGGAWCVVRVNLNRSTIPATFIPPRPEPYSRTCLVGRMGHKLGRSLEHGLSRALMQARPDFGSGPGFLQGNWPTTVSAILFSVYI